MTTPNDLIKWKISKTKRTGKRNWHSLCQEIGFSTYPKDAFTITFHRFDTEAMRSLFKEHKAKVEEQVSP